MVEALVEHDYVAQEADELTIKKGDVIRDVIRKPGGWWEGVLSDKKGMFPDNFVRVIEKEAGVVLRNRKVRQCRVIYSYKQDHEDELSLSVGDLIDVVCEEEEGWWRGMLHGKEGVFPSNFVEEIVPIKSKSKAGSREDLPDVVYDNEPKSPSLPPKPMPTSEPRRNTSTHLSLVPTSEPRRTTTTNLSLGKTLCEARYSYKGQNDDELTIKEGDIITLLSRDGPDVGWWKGEINGQVGVFPDNFVTIIPGFEEKQAREDRKSAKTSHDPQPLKPSAIVSQRKSLEIKPETESKVSPPPVVGKKPSLPIKKSPTNTVVSGGLFSGLRKKVIDVVDGSASSKSSPPTGKYEPKPDKASDMNENAFDQVERNSLLQDVRATRAKAPGRRLPSIVLKEGEVAVVNGNTELVHLDNITEHSAIVSAEEDAAEVRPKVREWEKHKAPWLEEMKLNQAKRTSPGPEPSRVKLPSADKSSSPDLDESRSSKTSPYEKDSSPVDMSKSMPSLGSKLKTPPNELDRSTNPLVLRNKPAIQPTSNRPQTIAHLADTPKTTAANPVTKISPHLVQNNRTPSPVLKPTASDKVDLRASGDSLQDVIPQRQYAELLERIQKLEAVVEKQSHSIEELKSKLKVESEMRILLQVELDKVAQSQVMHV